MTYLAVDPGNTTGWASFDIEGKPLDMGMLQVVFGEDLDANLITNLLDTIKPTVLIIEEYVLFGHKARAQTGSKMFTSRIIGLFEAWAGVNNVKVHFQRSDIKPIGYKWAGIKVPRNHSQSHQTDAYVHGIYWLIRNNIRKPGVST